MKCELRIIRKKDSYFLQRKYSFLFIFYRWKNIFSSTVYGDVLLAQTNYVPREALKGVNCQRNGRCNLWRELIYSAIHEQ